VIWGVREEMARTVDDMLSRRTRALFLNARAAIEMAPAVAKLTAHQLEAGPDWIDQQLQQFNELAGKYLLP
jgi:glycerol-3-phosphate dehydrogenase